MLTTPNPNVAFHTASMFQQIDIGVTLRPAADTFREEVAGVCISWLADMCQCRIGGDDELFRRLVARAMLERRSPGGKTVGTLLAPDLKELEWGRNEAGHDAKRVDWMFHLDVRMWKRIKWEMRQVYAGIYCLDWEVRKHFSTSTA